MYYPYFRGKQFELVLLREQAGLLADASFNPIIEPVKLSTAALYRSLDAMSEAGVHSTVVANPQVGDWVDDHDALVDDIFRDRNGRESDVSIGYVLHPGSDVGHLLRLMETFSEWEFSILHRGFLHGERLAEQLSTASNVREHIFFEKDAGRLYRRHFPREEHRRVLVRDGFTQMKNADYPDDEHFSDLHITHAEEGMNGFGDFLIVGDTYSETGGPAWAVAIHITYAAEDGDMYVFHFKSDRSDSPTDPAGKFQEAVTKLVDELDSPDTQLLHTSATHEFASLHNREHYPGLGYVKKISMQHHLELMTSCLSTQSG